MCPPRRRKQEPVKYEALAFLRGEAPPPPRRALAICELPGRRSVVEALVELGGGQPAVLGWKEVRPLLRRGWATQ